MTVAAVIVAGSDMALADASGRPAVRRIVDVAWAGGALPIVVVADDPDGELSRALGGSPATRIAAPRGGDVAAYRAGIAAARDAVAGTGAVLLWPMSMTWIDPETVTSLIEAHGRRPQQLLRPQHHEIDGWPLLLPLVSASDLASVQDEADIGNLLAGTPATERLQLGDPGTIHGIDMAMDALPAFEGPSEPVGGPPPEWGAAAADAPD